MRLCSAEHRGTSVSQLGVDEEFINSALQQLDPEHGLVYEVAPLPRRLRDADVHLPLDAPPRAGVLELHHLRRITVYVKVPKAWKDISFLIIGYQSDRCFPSFVRSIER